MDSLELLNVLDVIKNEEVYTKRLNQLKEVQARLDQSQYIVATVEKAQDILERAKEKEAKANELVSKLEIDLKKVKEEVKADYEKRYDEVNLKAKSAAVKEQDAKTLYHQTLEIRDQNEKRTKELREWEQSVMVLERNAKEVEQLYTSKFKRIKQIIEE